MSAWNDFNDAEQQQSFDLIPKGTVAPVRMTIKPGGHDDAAQGWTGGYATQSFDTGSIFLACEFVILDGEYPCTPDHGGLHIECGPEQDLCGVLHRGRREQTALPQQRPGSASGRCVPVL